MTYLLLIIGFVLLIKGAGFLVDGASSIAKKRNISEWVIGLTIVSFGTSLPELIVNLFASVNGNSEIAIGNIFGSNICNVLLILGVAATIRKLPLKRSILTTEIPMAMAATFMVGFLANANLWSQSKNLYLSRFDGALMLVFFFMFIGYIIVISKQEKEEEQGEEVKLFSTKKSLLLIVAGVVMLFLGGKWVVDGAVKIAELMGLSQSFIGLTVIAVGTSLPELVTSCMAAYKNKTDLAIGNVIGSNIFNLLWILGLSSTIQPIPFSHISNPDILVMIGSCALIILAIVVNRKSELNRMNGIVLVLVYIAYLYYVLIRG